MASAPLPLQIIVPPMLNAPRLIVFGLPPERVSVPPADWLTSAVLLPPVQLQSPDMVPAPERLPPATSTLVVVTVPPVRFMPLSNRTVPAPEKAAPSPTLGATFTVRLALAPTLRVPTVVN